MLRRARHPSAYYSAFVYHPSSIVVHQYHSPFAFVVQHSAFITDRSAFVAHRLSFLKQLSELANYEDHRRSSVMRDSTDLCLIMGYASVFCSDEKRWLWSSNKCLVADRINPCPRLFHDSWSCSDNLTLEVPLR